MKTTQISIVLFSLFLLSSCQQDNDLDVTTTDIPDINNGGNNNNNPNVPNGNDDIELGELGRLLFYDPILSGGQDVACATCHHPEFGYADGRALSIGIEGSGLGPDRVHTTAAQNGFVRRNSPTIVNTAFNGMDENGNYDPTTAPMFWDNRLVSLETQALGPIEDFAEMRGHAFGEGEGVEGVVGRLQANAEYQSLFTGAFGHADAINSQNIASAIAAFERMITATDSPFDRFQAGDQNAMSQAQIAGMNTFNQVGCDNCHSGPMFSDYQLHTLGIPDNNLINGTDSGADGDYSFRTPTLRNLNSTGPYFHNGVGGNLQETIRFYITARNFARNNGNGGGGGGNGGPGGGGLNINPSVQPNDIDNDVRNLNNLNNNDIQEIIAFIGALNDENFDRRIPDSVPSGLQVGGDID